MSGNELTNTFKAAVALMVSHPEDDLSFLKEITELKVGVLWRRGDPRQTPKGNPLSGYRKESYCLLGIDERDSESTAETIERFLGLLERSKEALSRITATGGEMCFSVGWFHDENFEQGLSWDLMQKLSEMQISINFDVYGKS